LSELEGLMSMTSSYKAYRAALQSAQPPCIPYLCALISLSLSLPNYIACLVWSHSGVHLTDLTFADDGNPDKLTNLINFNKRRQIYCIVRTALQHQKYPYLFSRSEPIIAFVQDMQVLDERKLYALSLVREPRNASRADIQ
jgi:hypothetical protein